MQQEEPMIANRVKTILSKIQSAKQLHQVPQKVQLIAVSKTKPVQDIQSAYDAGIRHFGQNYAEEIEQKHPKLPEDIKWHFIGHLQSNKIKKILVPNLHLLESVDRQRYRSNDEGNAPETQVFLGQCSLAQKLEKELNKQERTLNVLLQVKTSSKDTKSGVALEQIDALYNFVKDSCPHLRQVRREIGRFRGLMTIGKQGDIETFGKMRSLKARMCETYGLKGEEFQLSMGMSSDFEQAIGEGATIVRVGTSIFGQRNYQK